MKRILIALFLLTLGCTQVEQAIVVSPLVGAQRVESSGSGTIDTVVKTGRYAYLQFDNAPRDQWFVVMGAPPQPGTFVRFKGYAQIPNFYSKSLDRVFPILTFSTLKKTEKK